MMLSGHRSQVLRSPPKLFLSQAIPEKPLILLRAGRSPRENRNPLHQREFGRASGTAQGFPARSPGQGSPAFGTSQDLP